VIIIQVPGFEKVKIKIVMRYGKINELIILSDGESQGKMNIKIYTEIIMDGEILDSWMEDIEDYGYLLMMEDGVLYHKGSIIV
jgi:hypothetical protein